jgi:hypothetical protein
MKSQAELKRAWRQVQPDKEIAEDKRWEDHPEPPGSRCWLIQLKWPLSGGSLVRLRHGTVSSNRSSSNNSNIRLDFRRRAVSRDSGWFRYLSRVIQSCLALEELR